METYSLLDAPLPCKFCESLPAAEEQAAREAADTGGSVLRVNSIRIEPNRLVLTGLIPQTALVPEVTSDSPGSLRPRSMGNLHTTWSSLLQPGGSDQIGYLVLHTPVGTPGQLPESEDGDFCWAALAIERTLHTLRTGCVGAISCASCNRPIPQQRLLAIPNTRVCTNCQQKRENRRAHDRSN
jgi:hypothetical protein